VHPALCAGNQNTTTMLEANFKVKKIPNGQSSAFAGFCITVETWPLRLQNQQLKMQQSLYKPIFAGNCSIRLISDFVNK